jgi:hypothetical protein
MRDFEELNINDITSKSKIDTIINEINKCSEDEIKHLKNYIDSLLKQNNLDDFISSLFKVHYSDVLAKVYNMDIKNLTILSGLADDFLESKINREK